jgi:D-3-phosphoglycerate dehydrogenase
MGEYLGVVIRSRLPFDAEMIASAKNLKFIARSGAGLENIDLDTAQKAGITVFNSPEGNRDAVGEHAIGMLLALFNQLKKADTEVRAGIWDREGNRGLELAGKTVGIIGYGHMGAAFAKKLSGFDCEILAYDKYKSGFGTDLVNEVNLETLKENADVISIHLPLSAETDSYVDEAFIHSCSKPFYLINTARGRHVKTSDLLSALTSGKVLGACLDVLEFETKSFDKPESLPTEFQALAASDKVLLSPHVAGWTVESYKKLSDFLADKITALGL